MRAVENRRYLIRSTNDGHYGSHQSRRPGCATPSDVPGSGRTNAIRNGGKHHVLYAAWRLVRVGLSGCWRRTRAVQHVSDAATFKTPNRHQQASYTGSMATKDIDRPLGFNTRALHAGYDPDPTTHARAVPIYQPLRSRSTIPTMRRGCLRCRNSATSIRAS